MIRSLRNLLVALAAVSTVLAGARSAVADVRPAGTAAWTADDLRDDGREDGSDARTEQVEEDDSEEQESRLLHLLATSALFSALNGCAASLQHDGEHRAHRPRMSSALVRGPPTSL
jgi:ribosomal protein L12E/L44/L45/RPP1/RPP2